MALFANRSALVQGAAPAAAPAALVRVCLVRAICIGGQAIHVGTELEVPAHWAAELVATGKARLAPAEPANSAPPPPTRPTPAAKRAPKE